MPRDGWGRRSGALKMVVLVIPHLWVREVRHPEHELGGSGLSERGRAGKVACLHEDWPREDRSTV